MRYAMLGNLICAQQTIVVVAVLFVCALAIRVTRFDWAKWARADALCLAGVM